VPARGDGVQVTLAQQDIVDSLQFHGSAILGLEQDGIPYFHATHVRADRHDLRPIEPSPYLRCCRDDDASTGFTFTVLRSFTHEHSVV